MGLSVTFRRAFGYMTFGMVFDADTDNFGVGKSVGVFVDDASCRMSGLFVVTAW